MNRALERRVLRLEAGAPRRENPEVAALMARIRAAGLPSEAVGDLLDALLERGRALLAEPADAPGRAARIDAFFRDIGEAPRNRES